MFADMLQIVFGGCTNPMEYTLSLLLFYMLLDGVINLAGSLIGASRSRR